MITKIQEECKTSKKEFEGTRTKPVPLPVNLDGIPERLKKLRIWVLWRFEEAEGRPGWTKVLVGTRPSDPEYRERTGLRYYRAKTNKEQTWSHYEQCEAILANHPGEFDGLGVVLGGGNLLGGDLDDALEGGVLKPWARDILDRMSTYSEVSPSGTGVKFFCHASYESLRRSLGGVELVRDLRNRKTHHGCTIEFYDKESPRFFTITGHGVEGCPSTINDRQVQWESLYAELFAEEIDKSRKTREIRARHVATAVQQQALSVTDSEVVDLARHAANGEKFRRLYEDGDLSMHDDNHSSADMALVTMLSFWCGHDLDKIDRIFRSSALCRTAKRVEKWERLRLRTIARALELVPEPFDWGRKEMLERTAHQEELLEKIVARRGKAGYQPGEIIPGTVTPREVAGCYEAGDEWVQKTPSTPVKVDHPFTVSPFNPRVVLLSPSQARSLAQEQVNDVFIDDLGAFGRLHILSGEPGSGKSVIAAEMVVSVSLGEPFLGRAIAPCHIVLIDPENSLKDAINGYDLMFNGRYGNFENTVSWVYQDVCPKPIDTQFVADVIATAQAKHGPKVVVMIDTLRGNFMTGDFDENNATSIANILLPLKDLAMRTGAAVWVLHHNNWTGRVSGSTQLRGACDFALEYHRPDNKPKATLKRIRARGTVGIFQDLLVYQNDNGRLFCAGTKEQLGEKRKTRKDVEDMEFLKTFLPKRAKDAIGAHDVVVHVRNHNERREDEGDAPYPLGEKRMRKLLHLMTECDLAEATPGTQANQPRYFQCKP